MALIKKGFFGNVSGKIGEVQGANWKGRDTLQGWNARTGVIPTIAQSTQHNKMGQARTFAKDCLALIPFPYNAREYESIGAWASMVRDFIKGCGNDGWLQNGKFQIRNGTLPIREFTTSIIDAPSYTFQIDLAPFAVPSEVGFGFLGWLIVQIPSMGETYTVPCTIGYSTTISVFSLKPIISGSIVNFYMSMIKNKSVMSTKTSFSSIVFP